MPTDREIEDQAQFLSTEIIKLLLKVNKDFDATLEPIDAIAIFMFPKDHEKNGAVRATLIGRICSDCIIRSLTQVEDERGRERMPIA